MASERDSTASTVSSEPEAPVGPPRPLPVPVEETDPSPADDADSPDRRTYVEIRPTDTPLSPRAVGQAMEQLHSTLEHATQTRIRDKLRGRAQRPSVEWLLVADGNEDTAIRYLVGITDEERHDELKRILRTALPNTYELQTVAWHPSDITSLSPTTNLTDLYTSDAKYSSASEADSPPLAGVDYYGHAKWSCDWQTSLTAFDELTSEARTSDDETHRLPLTTLVETMRDADAPVVYQVLCRPYQDISSDVTEYKHALEIGRVTLREKFWDAVSPRTAEEEREYEPPESHQKRIDALDDREVHRTFQVTARAVVFPDETGRPPVRIAESLASTLSPLEGVAHEVKGTVESDGDTGGGPGTETFAALCDRVHDPVAYERAWNRLRRTFTSPGLVVAPDELPGLCLLDGGALTPTGQRAVGVRHSENTGIALPPPGKLRRYEPPGMALARPLTSDRLPVDDPLVLPPEYQPRHQVIVGGTGSGKSVLTIGAMLSNLDATDGPDILFDYKGGGTAQEYLQAHYRTQGDLDDVYYFDLTHVLPAFSFFDIGPLLDAGLPREEARSRKTGHYEAILQGAMRGGQYGEATESPQVIQNHLRALYDPVHGSDSFTHSKLYNALQETQQSETPPSVSNQKFESYFTSLLERDRDVFAKVVGGAISRVETIALDERLSPLFNHDPEGDDARFDFADVVDEDAVIVFDFGGMETRIKRALTLVLLSNLWTALKAREERTPTGVDNPQVNLYLEEAKDVANTELVDTLLAQGRSFDLSLTLGVQFLEQLDSPDPEDDTYREALNETATFVVGNVAVDRHLPEVLATDDMPPSEVRRRLNALDRGTWFVRPGAGFGESAVRPFLAESMPAPPGHPASDDTLVGRDRRLFEDAVESLQDRTREQAGIELGEPSTVDHEFGTRDEDVDTDALPRVDTLLPYTKRLPECVDYDENAHAIRCDGCNNRYNASAQGMIQAIDCCHSMADIDLDDFPICELNLKLSSEEIVESEYSPRQLCFMQAVYNVEQRVYDHPEYDIVYDSMDRIKEYAGVDTDDVQQLIDDGLVREDTKHPHHLYSVTPDGRDVIQESHRHGVAFGHGKGDLDESAEHVMGIEVALRWLTREYVNDPDSAAVTARPYYNLKEGSIDADAFFGDDEDVDEAADDFERHRLDVVALDENGDVVVAVEVERINHDTRRAVPADYDKMAACDPEEAIWLTMTTDDAHEILAALNDPLDGEPRVEKTYSSNTPTGSFRIDQPGFTDIYTLKQMRDQLL